MREKLIILTERRISFQFRVHRDGLVNFTQRLYIILLIVEHCRLNAPVNRLVQLFVRTLPASGKE